MWQRIAHLPEAAVHAAEMTSEARLRASSAPPGAIEVISSGAAARNHELPEAREDVGRALGAPQRLASLVAKFGTSWYKLYQISTFFFEASGRLRLSSSDPGQISNHKGPDGLRPLSEFQHASTTLRSYPDGRKCATGLR